MQRAIACWSPSPTAFVRRRAIPISRVGWGGDEFAVLLGDTRRDGVIAVFDRISAGLGRLSAHYQGGIGFSAGVLCFAGEVSLHEVLRDADALMYRAKRAGRGRVLVEQWQGPDATAPAAG